GQRIIAPLAEKALFDPHAHAIDDLCLEAEDVTEAIGVIGWVERWRDEDGAARLQPFPQRERRRGAAERVSDDRVGLAASNVLGNAAKRPRKVRKRGTSSIRRAMSGCIECDDGTSSRN